MEETTIKIDHLTESTTERYIQRAFSAFGDIKEVRLQQSKHAGENCAYVTYQQSSSAQKAVTDMNAQKLNGRALRVEITSVKQFSDSASHHLHVEQEPHTLQESLETPASKKCHFSLKLTNIAKATTEKALVEKCAKFPGLHSVKLLTVPTQPFNYAWVNFTDPRNAQLAQSSLNELVLNGSKLAATLQGTKSPQPRTLSSQDTSSNIEVSKPALALKASIFPKQESGIRICIGNLHTPRDESRYTPMFSIAGSDNKHSSRRLTSSSQGPQVSCMPSTYSTDIVFNMSRQSLEGNGGNLPSLVGQQSSQSSVPRPRKSKCSPSVDDDKVSFALENAMEMASKGVTSQTQSHRTLQSSTHLPTTPTSKEQTGFGAHQRPRKQSAGTSLALVPVTHRPLAVPTVMDTCAPPTQKHSQTSPEVGINDMPDFKIPKLEVSPSSGVQRYSQIKSRSKSVPKIAYSKSSIKAGPCPVPKRINTVGSSGSQKDIHSLAYGPDSKPVDADPSNSLRIGVCHYSPVKTTNNDQERKPGTCVSKTSMNAKQQSSQAQNKLPLPTESQKSVGSEENPFLKALPSSALQPKKEQSTSRVRATHKTRKGNPPKAAVPAVSKKFSLSYTVIPTLLSSSFQETIKEMEKVKSVRVSVLLQNSSGKSIPAAVFPCEIAALASSSSRLPEVEHLYPNFATNKPGFEWHVVLSQSDHHSQHKQVSPHINSQLNRLYSPNGKAEFDVDFYHYKADFKDLSLEETSKLGAHQIHYHLQPALPVWKFHRDNEFGFVPHESHTSKQIEDMLWYGGGTLEIEGTKHTIDFTRMLQINQCTMTPMPLQREPPVQRPLHQIELQVEGLEHYVTEAIDTLKSASNHNHTSHSLSMPESLRFSIIAPLCLYNECRRYCVDANLDDADDEQKLVIRGESDYCERVMLKMERLSLKLQQDGLNSQPLNTPPYWELETQHAPRQLMPVSAGTTEWSNIYTLMRKTIESVKLENVQRIQDVLLWRRYSFAKQCMLLRKDDTKINEVPLFHGTRDTAPEKVYSSEKGFDFRLSAKGLWGHGAYFAENASYSDSGYAHKLPDGSKQLLLARVLTGESVELHPDRNLRRPPVKPASERGPSEEHYDTVTGMANGSRVYVVYDHEKAYPEYLITYRTR